METGATFILFGLLWIIGLIAAFFYLRNVWYVVLTIRTGNYFTVRMALRVLGVFVFLPLGIVMGFIPVARENSNV